jgi:hypothetical protein
MRHAIRASRLTDTLSFSAVPNVARTATRPSSWVRGPLWDAVFIQNALWLLPLALLLAQGSAARGPLDALYFALTALFWIGHRIASTWLAYGTEAYRPLLKTQPIRFIAIPLAVTALCFAILLPPDAALPWTRAERAIALAILDYAFNTWHFGAQHFGALSLYRSRAGGSRTTRRTDRLFALGIGGALIFVADLLAGSVAYQDRWLGSLPAWFAAEQQPIRLAATALLVAATAAKLVAELRAARISLPRILYVLGLAAMVAVALQPRSLFLFLVIWTSQHWILAVGLSAQTPAGENAAAQGPLRRTLHALNTRPWMLITLLMAVSAILLPLFEIEANWQTPGAVWYGDRLFGALAQGLRHSTLVPALLALGFATGFVHYLLDRAVYRFSDPEVRAAAAALVTPR